MKKFRSIIAALLCVGIVLSMCALPAVYAEDSTLQQQDDSRMDAIRVVLSELEIMQGDPSGDMRYGDLVSRAEFSKVAVMASSYKDFVVPEMKLTVFPDVKGDNWASPYVWAGVKNSIFSGYPDGTFKPNNTVLYEEAANVFLKLLGYTDSDIGPTWPYGPINLAANVGLDDNIDVYAGKALTRYDVANMAYNMLKATAAKGNGDYINSLGYSIIDDTVLIATYEQDTSIGAKNIFTSSGTFEIGANLDKNDIGLRGDLVVKNNKTALCLIPSGQKKVTYTVTGTVGGGLMLGGKLFNIDENMNVYYGKQQYSYKNLYSLSIDEGDEFSLIYTDNGFVDYALLVDKSKSYEVSEVDFGKYVVYSVVNNDIVFYKDGQMLTYNIPDSTDVYKDDARVTYSSIKNQLSMGDILYLSFKTNGKVDYAKYEEGDIVGPVSARSSWQSDFGVNSGSVSIMRNGAKASVADITSNDVLYYCEDLNLVLAYYKTVTGVYEKAIPNRDTPTSVTISGKTYEIEGIEAFNKLSSGGELMLGDTITVLFGKDDKIADVITTEMGRSDVYGYLTATGTGKYTQDDGSEYSSFYVRVVLPDGETAEYTTSKDYKDYLNSIVRVTISGGKATVSRYSSSGDVSGKVNWGAKTIGADILSDDVSILDIRTLDDNKASGYVSVFPQRIDGITLSELDVCYAERDSDGKIVSLILDDVTGDSWSYGILSSARTGNNKNVIGFGIYSKGGSYQTTTTGLGGMAVGKGIRMAASGSSVSSLAVLNQMQSISEITEEKVIGSTTHTISDKVEVYVRSGSLSDGYDYNYADIGDVVGIDRSKIISVYYDKDDSKGGRVRVIVVAE